MAGDPNWSKSMNYKYLLPLPLAAALGIASAAGVAVASKTAVIILQKRPSRAGASATSKITALMSYLPEYTYAGFLVKHTDINCP